METCDPTFNRWKNLETSLKIDDILFTAQLSAKKKTQINVNE